MEFHVLEPMCKFCTVFSTAAVFLAVSFVLVGIAAVVDRIHGYFSKLEERISKLEKTNNEKKLSYGGKKNVR